jgi:hypothetical protein
MDGMTTRAQAIVGRAITIPSKIFREESLWRSAEIQGRSARMRGQHGGISPPEVRALSHATITVCAAAPAMVWWSRLRRKSH